MIDFKTNNLPILSWCHNPDDATLKQAFNIANLPFIHQHVALMPDTHCGYGMPIGGVIACRGVVIPNAVGVDIGCGMSAICTTLKVDDLSTDILKLIMGKIREYIPVGFSHRTKPIDWFGFDSAPKIDVVLNELSSAAKQLGTLGGGNHFIEIQKGSDGFVWVMLHSGSRNIGYKIAKHYNQIAQDLCHQWYSNIPAFTGDDSLAFLPINSIEGQEYIQAMQFAVKFAYENRATICDQIKLAFTEFIPNVTFDKQIDVSHNYAKLEHHFGQNVWVHRKGATSAKLNELGIIPGSQGSRSYIVKGLGNPLSFCSCSHGAGRALSRTRAIKELDFAAEKAKLDDLGILHAVCSVDDLAESTLAYKDIDLVMSEQSDLVDIVVELFPLGVIKA